ncbi:hypothetical protein T265_04592 [Opisthorchis viverrini]|uniref:Uncharacterized protein n=1 Tax=Opisthorchis viverrini TaxID=6198 RepID=A0A074ZMP0_OPIVI|nr:hypothetical protein T265_04592 [Opisthorchis viverrini]KER28643.1 hypothetical protein T265_04592 [Opisthorchis viverrini]
MKVVVRTIVQQIRRRKITCNRSSKKKPGVVGEKPSLRLTWNPAESLVYDVLRQLNVLHQAASCFSRYDILKYRDTCIFVMYYS